LAWASSFPAKTADLAVVIAISYTVSVSDAAKGSDYIRKLPYKKAADSYKGADYVRKAALKWVTDSYKGADYVRKLPSKRLTDTGKTSDYMRKLPLKALSDTSKGADYILKRAAFIRSIADSSKAAELLSKYALLHVSLYDVGRGVDYVRKLPIKRLTDSYKATDYIKKLPLKKLLDSSKGADYIKKIPLRCFLDAAKGADYVQKTPLKKLVDTSKAADRITKTAIFIRILADAGKASDYMRSTTSFLRSVYDWFVGECLTTTAKGKLVNVSDVTLTSDYICKSVARWFTDAGKSADLVSKIMLRNFSDAGLVSDYVKRATAIALLDRVFGEHYPAKDVSTVVKDLSAVLEALILGIPHHVDVSDSLKSSDYLTRDLVKGFIDFTIIRDASYRLVTFILRDMLAGEHVISKGVSKVEEDEAKPSDYMSKLPLKAVLDASKPEDYIKTIVSVVKIVSDLSEAADYLRVSVSFVKALRDYLCGEHTHSKDVIKVEREESVASEVVKKEIGKKAFETTLAADKLLKEIIKAITEPIPVKELITKIWLINFKDITTTAEIAAKVGFKLAGYDVRRVYFLPKEFQVWWDIVESRDHNTKIEVCKALIDAFKRVGDKLGA
jgi:hypothetical protein